jgi:WD40 repeat protein/serine/threonine protein kinase
MPNALTMSAANPEQSIFLAALELPTPAERAAYLKSACGADAALIANVQELLAAYETGDDFLECPPPNAAVDEPPVTERPGTSIGPYKLLQQIGEGGMGVVYMAEQEQPIRRRVALKIIKPGMDSAQVIARFEVERQALALMDHQNIARVLDAGTTDSGRPYFVMELVHGVPITEYCNAIKLSPRQRLELFVPVCQAIQHAHQKGIIHRDIKPSNIMVTLHDGQPVPKVIDFGVAKATEQRLTERTLFTQYGTIVGTLEYMAPEQAEMSGLGVDTRSDIYALGVLLYELLTGTTPLERSRLREAAYDEMLRLIREEEPPRPSQRISTSGDRLATISAERSTEPTQLSRLVHGELDWIVMRCLEKDRTRRYETANGLARDLQHYLADEPVEACPPRAGYKLRKFARKHKAGLATAIGFVSLLVLGTAVSAWQAVRATQAEAVALAHEQQANDNAVQAQEKEQEANQQRDEAHRQRDEVRALNDRLRRTLYAAHMNLAHNAWHWHKGGAERVQQLLEQHRPKPGESDLRGFEWRYLYRLSHAELFTIKGRGALSVAYSPDGKRLASPSGDNTLKVWDAQTGQELSTLRGHTGQVNSVAYSPDGKHLASASGDKTVKVWDAQTGQKFLSLEGHTDAVWSVAYSPDGKRLASASGGGGVKVWDAQTGQKLLTLKGPGGSVAFSPDGKRLAAGGLSQTKGGEVKVWDAQTGQELLSPEGHSQQVYSVAYSPDGQRLASAAADKTVKVWDAQTGRQLLTFKGHTDEVWSVAYSPDGKHLASGSEDETVKVWDALSGKELFTIRGHTDLVESVAFSPDGKHLASICGDGTVRVWDVRTVQNPFTLEAGAHPVASVAFSPDGKLLASGSRAWIPFGVGPSDVKVWDVQTGQELFTLKGHTSSVTGVAFSPDGKRLASASIPRGKSGAVKVWDTQTGQELLSPPSKWDYNGLTANVAFSPDGKRLASAVGLARVCDAQTGQELFTKTWGRMARMVAFSQDGTRLASGAFDEMLVSDAQTGRDLLNLKGHTGFLLAFSPDGNRLAGAPNDNTVKVWDALTGQELLTLKGHTRRVASAAFSPDGKRLVSAADDKTVKVWDLETGQELLTVEGHSGHNGVAFSPDGHRLAAGSADGTVKIYDATPLPEQP